LPGGEPALRGLPDTLHKPIDSLTVDVIFDIIDE